MATTIFNYQANTPEAYIQLAAYAVTLPVTVTAFPKYLTVAIPEQAAKEVSEFIDAEKLNVTVAGIQLDKDNADTLLVAPTTDPTILREIALGFQQAAKQTEERCKEALAESSERRAGIEKDALRYNKWWQQASEANGRIRNQIKAISVLLDAITNEQ